MKGIFNYLGVTLIIMSFTALSCDNDDKTNSDEICNVSNPAEDLDWLKEAIDNVENDEYSYFAMADYNGETVFYYGNCNPLINFVSIVMNCNGENLGNTNDLYDDLTDIEILWQHDNSQCNFQE